MLLRYTKNIMPDVPHRFPYPFHSLLSSLLVNLFLTGGFVVMLNFLHFPIIQLCSSSPSRAILTALGLTTLINIFILTVGQNIWRIVIFANLCLIVLLGIITYGLGSYERSPLNLSGGRSSIKYSFLVTRPGHINKPVAPGEVIMLRYGFDAGISVAADLPNTTCHWTSLHGATLDSPDQCDIVYAPPGVENDILTVRIGSTCTLQPIRGQIKITIYP